MERKLATWIPAAVLAILTVLAPAVEPSLRQWFVDFVANNPTWSSVILFVAGFIMNLLRSPQTNPLPR
jgi:hypothetical protein